LGSLEINPELSTKNRVALSKEMFVCSGDSVEEAPDLLGNKQCRSFISSRLTATQRAAKSPRMQSKLFFCRPSGS